jgi:adenylate cyclase
VSDTVQQISDWLVRQGLKGADFESVVAGFCERLVAAGIPLERGMLAMRTLHPEIDAHSFIWRPGQPLETANFGMDSNPAPQFAGSPLNYLLSQADRMELRRRLAGPGAELDFDVLREFAAEGCTDYLIQKVPFSVTIGGGRPTGMLCSWLTRAPEGFSERDLSALRRLSLRLGLAVSNILQREITLNVLDTYVGKDAGDRILRGEIRLGSMREIDAVILFADLRGFTALADSMEGAEVVALLNEYFELIVPPIVERGGEILKYLGDGVLAIFALSEMPKAEVCRGGLDAAVAALENVSEFNAGRKEAGLPLMSLDIGVHLGRVQSGNVGASNRFDFTVIGTAVNEASRLEAMCDALGGHLVVSETFARAAESCRERLVPLGRHELRGVRGAQELYTVRYRHRRRSGAAA